MEGVWDTFRSDKRERGGDPQSRLKRKKNKGGRNSGLSALQALELEGGGCRAKPAFCIKEKSGWITGGRLHDERLEWGGGKLAPKSHSQNRERRDIGITPGGDVKGLRDKKKGKRSKPETSYGEKGEGGGKGRLKYALVEMER